MITRIKTIILGVKTIFLSIGDLFVDIKNIISSSDNVDDSVGLFPRTVINLARLYRWGDEHNFLFTLLVIILVILIIVILYDHLKKKK